MWSDGVYRDRGPILINRGEWHESGNVKENKIEIQDMSRETEVSNENHLPGELTILSAKIKDRIST